MGRWAQRRVRGGGDPAIVPEALGLITSVRFNTALTYDVTFDVAVTAAAFTPANLVDTTSGRFGSSIAQLTANSLRYTMSGFGLAVGHTWNYSDTVAGVATPQSGVTV